MSQVLHEIERKIIESLRKEPSQISDSLSDSTSLSIDQVRRGVEWLKMKKLVEVDVTHTPMIRLGKNGLRALKEGLPERRLLEELDSGKTSMAELQDKLGSEFGPAMGRARKNGWVAVSGDTMELREKPQVLPGEELIRRIRDGKITRPDSKDVDDLLKRPDFLIEEDKPTHMVSLSASGMEVDLSGPSGAIDVEADAPAAYVARTHPLKDVIDEVREAFVALGFSEIRGSMAQPSFWNFDALFTPQDHPAREMQDTFYIDADAPKGYATADQMRKVASSHRLNWKYKWSPKESKRMVLRTHTTCVTIRHLAENPGAEARVFSLGRVFRNEKPSYKHLAEFHQIEGVVMGRDVTLRDLMGIQREFYRRIGLPKVRFWPTFFPYTEPSLQTMVYNERLGKWVELFGMGIFRPEVTRPLGIRMPVLAWGGGLERIAMIKYGIDDVREFYANKLAWLRGPRCP